MFRIFLNEKGAIVTGSKRSEVTADNAVARRRDHILFIFGFKIAVYG